MPTEALIEQDESKLIATGLIMEDIFLPEPAGIPDRPERKLLRAMLKRAVRDLRGRNEQLKAEAEVWFRAEHDSLGSFLWLCDMIMLDPAWLRAQLKLEM